MAKRTKQTEQPEVSIQPISPLRLEPADYYRLRLLNSEILATKQAALEEAQAKVAAAIQKRDEFVKGILSKYPGLAHGRFDTRDDTCELIPV